MLGAIGSVLSHCGGMCECLQRREYQLRAMVALNPVLLLSGMLDLQESF
jgi:hypothetical protein